VPHANDRFRGQEIAAGGFEELQNSLVFPRGRVRYVNDNLSPCFESVA
jgi:hypothetical protein